MNPTHPIPASAYEQHQDMRNYYKAHAQIYDLTRWTFLFGRLRVLNHLNRHIALPGHILEVGCGTGFNLKGLRKRYPKARITGLDVSADMVKRATESVGKRDPETHILQRPYAQGTSQFTGNIDVILFSYALTMINPQWRELLEQAVHDLKPGGLIAVVDFHATSSGRFRRHMSRNHVKMEGHLLPWLESHFNILESQITPAYLGLWHYFTFIGKKKCPVRA